MNEHVILDQLQVLLYHYFTTAVTISYGASAYVVVVVGLRLVGILILT